MFCAAGPTTLGPVKVPVTVPEFAGHGDGVPAGPTIGGVAQKNTMTPPDTCLLPKWMWACVTVPVLGAVVPTSEYVRVNVAVPALLSRLRRRVPVPLDKIAPVGNAVAVGSDPISWKPSNRAKNSS